MEPPSSVGVARLMTAHDTAVDVTDARSYHRRAHSPRPLKEGEASKASCASDEPELDSGSGGTAPALMALSPLYTKRSADLGDAALWKEQCVILKQPRFRAAHSPTHPSTHRGLAD
jgi:hypothetical protein